MSSAARINQLENDIQALKRQLDYINKRFGLAPDQNELDEAINAMLSDRDAIRLADYIARGGKITGKQQ